MVVSDEAAWFGVSRDGMPMTEAVRADFRRLLGEENLRGGAAVAPWAMMGRTPALVAFPATLEEARECAALCHAHDLAVAPWGGGVRMEQGHPPERLDVVLATSRMDALVDYQPADMTVTAQAGMTLATLQRILGERNQWLPVDPPLPERSTLGGIVATRDTGAYRHAYGSPRDLLIGLRVADPEGELVRGGSMVVKNVAGYDLPKLYTGSHGTLGLISEVTFRVLPLPEARALLAVSVPDPDAAEEALASAMASDLLPAFIELVNPDACAELMPERAPGWTLLFGFEAAREDVTWQADYLAHGLDLPPNCEVAPLPEPVAQRLRLALADFPVVGQPRLTARCVTLSGEAAAFARDAEPLARRMQHRLTTLSHAGVGVTTLHLHAEPQTPMEATLALLAAVRERAQAVSGSVTVERADAQLWGRYDPWPDAGDALPLMRDMKRRLDPKNLWNPGRFVL